MITESILIGRGFKLREGKQTSYLFKNTVFGGSFSKDTNTFYFYGMQNGISSLNDLDVIITMIEFGL